MSRYAFSKKGKIKETTKKAVVFGVLIFLVGYLGKCIFPFYLYIVPIFFLIGLFLINIFCFFTLTFEIDSLGIRVNTTNNVSSTITWSEIERIEVIRKNSAIVEIKFYKKGKCFFGVGDYIESYDSLFQEIIDNAKANNIAMVNLSSKKGSPFF